jgi:hypothetical protein
MVPSLVFTKEALEAELKEIRAIYLEVKENLLGRCKDLLKS